MRAQANTKLLAATLWTVLLIAIGYLMVIAQKLLVPLVVAVFMFYIINALALALGRLRWRTLQPPRWLQLTAATVLLALSLQAMGSIISASVGELIKAAPEYQQSFQRLLLGLEQRLDFVELPQARELLAQVNLGALLKSFAAGFGGLMGNVGLVLVFVLFLFLEQRYWPAKFTALVPDPAKRARVQEILADIDSDVRVFIGIKAAASLLTALASYAVMRLVGLDFAEFWALMVFILNWAPNVGSVIATALPSLLALVQFETLTPFFLIAGGIGLIQIVIGQILEPVFAGQRLNVTPLAIIVSLVVWSLLWGPVGAFICLPLLVIGMIVLYHFDSTRWLAILLSQNGQIARRRPGTSASAEPAGA